MISGETGSGKEVVARAIHRGSRRAARPLIAVDCGAIPETLVESALFGHERGAFTGADKRKDGYFQLAHGGTLFLDEIGNLPLAIQARLLRTLQERSVFPLGASQPVEVDVRIIAASNVVLEQEVRAGRFREDLYYRLAEYVIVLKPLRERREDIPAPGRPLPGRYGARARTARPRDQRGGDGGAAGASSGPATSAASQRRAARGAARFRADPARRYPSAARAAP